MSTRRPVLPARVVELLGREIIRSEGGHPALSATAMAVLHAALRPHEAALALQLAPGELLPDGSVRLYVPRNIGFTHRHLPSDRDTVVAEYDPTTGLWLSDVASGQRGLPRFAGHIWRIKGGDESMPERRFLALLGLAFLRAQAEAG